MRRPPRSSALTLNLKVRSSPYSSRRGGLDFAESGLVKLDRAFDGDLLFDNFGLNKTTKNKKDAAVVAGLLVAESLDDRLHLPDVHLSVRRTEAENAASGALGDFGSFHRSLKEKWFYKLASASLLMRFWSVALRVLPVTCVVVSTTRRPNSFLSSALRAAASALAASSALARIF